MTSTNDSLDMLLPPSSVELKEKTRRFIQDEIIPMESDPRQSAHDPHESLRCDLIAKARDAGLVAPHASREYGGLGLTHFEKAIVFEEAGYSRLVPVALNVHATDEGNIPLLEAVATPAQVERRLRPLAKGLTRSCFVMSEPSGAGSDPSMLSTTAFRDGDHYLINGSKWFITGAEGAASVIIMARMEDGSASMFIADMNRPEIRHVRQMESLDTCFPGGHGVLEFRDLRVHRDDVLGEIGKGFRYAQIRLAPARLTHCMRWLGQARRAHAAAVSYARERRAFGKRLGEHQGVSFMLADNDMDLRTARLHIWNTAQLLDHGHRCNFESSRTKVIASEAQWRVVDRSVQILGGKVSHRRRK
jgi:acyl-CoA dehydrogenase